MTSLTGSPGRPLGPCINPAGNPWFPDWEPLLPPLYTPERPRLPRSPYKIFFMKSIGYALQR